MAFIYVQHSYHCHMLYTVSLLTDVLWVVHKRMSILTFEGLSTTFKALTNVYFTYFCHKIKCYNGNICVKVASKMFSSNN